MMRTFSATLVADTRCALGESPFWDPHRGELAWVDIGRSTLLTYAEGRDVVSSPLPSETSFAALAFDGGVVAAHPAGIDHRSPDGSWHQVATPWNDPATSRTNDGAIDPNGKIWIGSTTRERIPGSGSIGVVLDGAWTERCPGLTLPNGIAWSPERDLMYYVDTLAGTLWQADFQASTPRGARPLFEMERADGLIDGICVDIEGGIWAAIWGGAAVIRLNGEGRVTAEVALDAPKTTSCAFVGTTLFVTTADPDADGPPGAGGLFAVDVGVEGVPVPPAKTAPGDPQPAATPG